ncbi:MAG: nuclear transport factor 2 family protein [Roseovarius sp.]
MTRFFAAALAATLGLGAIAHPAAADETLAQIGQPYAVAPADDLAARQVIARLYHALDAGDYALYGSVCAEDGVCESEFGDAVGPAQVAAALEQVRPFITGKRHVAANHVINRAGEQLVVTTYLVVFERETGLAFVGSAVNTDTLEQRDGAWKVVRHTSALDPATAAAIAAQMQGTTAD